MLHAGVAATAAEREKLEHLARYIARPPIASERLALTENGQVRYTLKTPYRDGTTHVIFEPEEFIARLAALVPKRRAHLTRYHGVFAGEPGSGSGRAQQTRRRRHRSWSRGVIHRPAADADVGTTAVAALVEHHDPLRMRFARRGGAYEQSNAGTASDVPS